MLPATRSSEPRLADVLQSSFAAVMGEPNRLDLPPVDQAIVLLVDGLGASSLRQRSGHARFLNANLSRTSTIASGFPTTTAAALTSLTTGAAPGQHGLIGYTALVPETGRVANQLSGWAADMTPALWQRETTIFERAREQRLDAVAIGPGRYAESGFTQAVLRGADYVSASSLSDRMSSARRWLDGKRRGIAYVYVPELDSTAHAHGWQSERWTRHLEDLDAAVSHFAASLRRGEGLLVTADHGVIDVPASSQILFGLQIPAHVQGVRHVAGEPRCLQLHLDPELSPAARARVKDAWIESEGDRAWVLTRDEAIDAGWFGDVADEVRPRIGDLIIAAQKNIAYYDARKKNDTSRAMIAQHGSWNPDELVVPLIRLGAFAR